jgi:aspartate/methionine/tyrosine aminotransferase
MSDVGLQINPVIRDMAEAKSIFINQLAADCQRLGEDVIVLSLGEAFFDIPLFDFNKLDVEKSYHYSDSRGLFSLRKRLADYYRTQYGARVDVHNEIIISAGSKPLTFMTMLAVLLPGDEILIHEPSWLSYPEQVRLIGGVPRFIPYDCEPADFDKYFTSRTKLVVVCNPNNPAGRLYTADELRLIYRHCRKHGSYMLVDEAYSDFVTDGSFNSIASIVPDKEGIIVVNSLSKNMGISGWRIGYAIANADIAYQILKLNQHIITCAPTILLMYCEKYFDQLLSITLPQVRNVVEKRERVRAMTEKVGLEALPGSATFYFFISIGNFPGTSNDFALSLLLDHRVAVVPGSAYGDSVDRFVRISIGTESDERILEALTLIKRMTEVNQLDSSMLAEKVAKLKERAASSLRASGAEASEQL